MVHELLARTAAEKHRAARLLCNSAAYLVDGGFQCIDPITKEGRHGAVAAKICNATSTPRGRFGVAFAGLVRDHRYDVNTISSLLTSPQGAGIFDFRLALTSYHMLVMAVPELIVHGTSSNGTTATTNSTIPLTPAEATLFKRRLQTSVRRCWGGDPISANNRVKATGLVFREITGAPGLADPDWQLRRYPMNLSTGGMAEPQQPPSRRSPRPGLATVPPGRVRLEYCGGVRAAGRRGLLAQQLGFCYRGCDQLGGQILDSGSGRHERNRPKLLVARLLDGAVDGHRPFDHIMDRLEGTSGLTNWHPENRRRPPLQRRHNTDLHGTGKDNTAGTAARPTLRSWGTVFHCSTNKLEHRHHGGARLCLLGVFSKLGSVYLAVRAIATEHLSANRRICATAQTAHFSTVNFITLRFIGAIKATWSSPPTGGSGP